MNKCERLNSTERRCVLHIFLYCVSVLLVPPLLVEPAAIIFLTSLTATSFSVFVGSVARGLDCREEACTEDIQGQTASLRGMSEWYTSVYSSLSGLVCSCPVCSSLSASGECVYYLLLASHDF